MRVVTKLGIGYGVFLGLLIVLLSYQLSVIRGLVDSNRALSETSSRVSVSSSHMLTLADALSEAAEKYALLDEDEGYAEQFREAARSFADTLHHFQTLPLTPGEIAAVEGVAEAWNAFLASRPLEEGTSPFLIANIKVETQALRDASEAAMVAEIGVSADRARTADRLSVAAVAVGLALSLLLSALIVRSISGSLRRLTAGTRAVAEGNFSIRLAEDTKDEFGQVARAFNLMTGKLGEADRAKQNFLSSVSHDLKSPLASMQETTRLLLDELTGEVSDDQRRLLQLSHASGERLSGLIARLLDLARMEAGAMEYNFEAVDLTELCRGAAEAAELRVATQGSAIRAELGEAPVWIRCDAPRIAQVLENLLDNAIKFSPPGTEIELLVARDGSPDGVVSVSVADRGPGVADTEKERIFERFYQTETSSPFAGAGVGLGLAICREIAAAHEGTIRIEDNPDGGSVFVLSLSTLAAAPEARPSAEEPSRRTAGGGGRVMRRGRFRDPLWPVLLVLTAACSSNPAVEETPELGPGSGEGAVVEAETPPELDADSIRTHNERALYKAALLQADPQADTYNPNQARADLATFLVLYPDGDYAESARLLSHLLIEVRRLGLSTVRLADRVEELEEKLEGVRQIDLEGTSP